MMNPTVFVNFPVKDVQKSAEFYTQLGFIKNDTFSNDQAVAMMWNDHLWIMLLSHDFYQQFIGTKTIADTHSTNSSLIALALESPEAVRRFAQTAADNGGNYYQVDMGIPEDQMIGYEVEDLDGNHLEPSWMAL